MRRIGVLMAYAESDREGQAWVAAFREELQKLGWTEGRQIRIDTRWAVQRRSSRDGPCGKSRATGRQRDWLYLHVHGSRSKAAGAATSDVSNYHPGEPSTKFELEQTEAAAKTLGVKFQKLAASAAFANRKSWLNWGFWLCKAPNLWNS
jgi:hypothetical protein